MGISIPWLQYPLTACSFFAMVLNAVLIPIIITKSSNVIGTYKNLLVAYTGVGVFTSLSIFLTLPVLYPSSLGCIFHNTVVHFSPKVAGIFIPIYAAGLAQWGFVLTLSFLFRYLIITGDQDLLFTRVRGALLFVACTIIMIIDCFVLSYFAPENEILDQLNGNVLETIGEDLHNLSSIGGMFFKPDGTLGHGFFHCFSYSIQMIPCICIMFFCTIKFKNLLATHQLSKQTKALHQRLFTLLLMQTLTPIIFQYLPILLLYSFAFLKMNAPNMLHLVLSSLLPVAQFIDPILIFTFIREYRNAFPCFRSDVRPTTEFQMSETSTIPSY